MRLAFQSDSSVRGAGFMIWWEAADPRMYIHVYFLPSFLNLHSMFGLRALRLYRQLNTYKLLNICRFSLTRPIMLIIVDPNIMGWLSMIISKYISKYTARLNIYHFSLWCFGDNKFCNVVYFGMAQRIFDIMNKNLD